MLLQLSIKEGVNCETIARQKLHTCPLTYILRAQPQLLMPDTGQCWGQRGSLLASLYATLQTNTGTGATPAGVT